MASNTSLWHIPASCGTQESGQHPWLWVEARDRLLSGRGNMLVKLCSTLTLADAGSKEIDQSASLRWLMEVVWFPYGFVGDRIWWEPIDARSARVSLLHDDFAAATVAEIDKGGIPVRVIGDRYRDIGGGKTVLTPWVGRCSDYRDSRGLRVSSHVEGSWILEGGELNDVRFQITTIEYNMTERFR